MQNSMNIYCDKVNKDVVIQFDFDSVENGIFKIKRALNNQKFNCLSLVYPDCCKLCTPMTKFDIWEKLIKKFRSSN